MTLMKRTFLTAIACLIVTGCASMPEHFISLETESIVPFEHVLEEIGEDRVIFIGEIHGDRKSHTIEFEVLKYLHERGDEVVIAFEMFPSMEQRILDQWVDGTIDERQFVWSYYRIVNLPYYTYKEILRFARYNGISVKGINADKNLISKVSKDGIDNVSPSVLKKIKFEKCSDNDRYSQTLGFYHIANILKSGDVKVVVMVGILHAIKVAVPDMLQKHLTVSYKVLMPAEIQEVLKTEQDEAIADFVWY
jgi:uncharacterized iron-regulated protein